VFKVAELKMMFGVSFTEFSSFIPKMNIVRGYKFLNLLRVNAARRTPHAARRQLDLLAQPVRSVWESCSKVCI